jgi:hypothetical protein
MKIKVLMLLSVVTVFLFFVSSCEKIIVDNDYDSNRTDSSEQPSDYIWNANKVVNIELNGTSALIDSTGATANGSTITIENAGTYRITGSLSNGQIIVHTPDTQIVRLILDDADITCLFSAPVYVKDAQKVVIVLADNSDNYLTDGTTYNTDNDGEPNAAIFSKSYISFYGDGSLTVKASYNDGIAGKDGLIIKSGKITVNALNDAIMGKDYIKVYSGNLTLNTTGNAILNTSGSGYDPACAAGLSSNGQVTINEAAVTIKSTGKGGKGISAGGDVFLSDANIIIITSGAGSTYKNSSGSTDCYSGTGISSDGDMTIESGTLSVSCSGTAAKGISIDGTLIIGSETEIPVVNITTTGAKIAISGTGMYASTAESKAVKCNGDITINNGTITISSADDGLKSESAINISIGTVSITKSTEGMEAPVITVNSGNVSIVSSDDGFNATKGNGGEANDGSCLYLKGGYVVVNASGGDALDSNGNIVMTGGTVIAHGPQSQPEVGMDFNGSFNVSGGLLVVSGTNSNMTEAPSTSSGLYSLKAMSSTSNSSLFHLQDASGNEIVTFKPIRNYYSMIISSEGLKNGSSYSIYTGGTSTGTNKNGLYTGGTYSGGTLKKTFTISSKLTSISF